MEAPSEPGAAGDGTIEAPDNEPRKPRAVILVDRNVECVALLSVLATPAVRPAAFEGAVRLHDAHLVAAPANPMQFTLPQARAVLEFPHLQYIIYCTEDLMGHLAGAGRNQKNSLLIADQLAQVLKLHPDPVLVISFTTAGRSGHVLDAAGVVLGADTFLRSASEVRQHTGPLWTSPHFGVLRRSRLRKEHQTGLARVVPAATERFISAPVGAISSSGVLYMGPDVIAVTTVNAADSHVQEVEQEAMKDFRALWGREATAYSLDEVHGLVHELTEAPFLFVTGITHRAGDWDKGAGTKGCAQQHAAAYNASVALAFALPELDLMLRPVAPVTK